MAKKAIEKTEKKVEEKKAIEKILSARVTEKSTLVSDTGCYVFNVAKNSTKSQISREINTKYKVKPVKVNVVNAMKPTSYRGRPGKTLTFKKAYVYLKKGDKIDIA